MKRYWFELTDERYNELGAFIPDGSNKQSAVNRAKRWMQENFVNKAELAINSMATGNLPEVISIELA